MAQSHQAPPPALSGQVYQHNNGLLCRASFPLREAGVFACRFLGNCPETCHCRSPPTPFRSLIHPQPKWRYIMKYINLRELYPDVYKTDTFVEVTEEVLAVIRATDRAEAAYTRRMYRHKAQYSLDCNNGIEKVVMVQPPTPEEILEDKQLREQLYAAVMALPDKQAKRIYAHFYLGMTPKEIAQAEGVDVSRVRDSIRKGLKKLAKQF